MSENTVATRICVLSILVSEKSSVERINSILSEYGDFIVGRMGIPYHKKNVNIISIVLDCPTDITNALTGKIGNLPGVSAKSLTSKQ